MLSSNIHCNCTTLIVDLIKSCSLSGKNAFMCTYAFLYVLKGKSKQCCISDNLRLRLTWEITCHINSTLSQKCPGRNNTHDLKALNVFSFILEITCFCALERDFSWLLWEAYWFQLKCYLFSDDKAKIAGQWLLTLAYFLKNSSYFERKWQLILAFLESQAAPILGSLNYRGPLFFQN